MEAVHRRGGDPGKLRRAVHVATADETYNCDSCAANQRNYCDSDGKREWTSRDGTRHKSRGPAPDPIWRFEAAYQLGDWRTCPKPEVPLDWSVLMTLHGAWLLGTLALPGGLMDQPAPYVDAMHLIEAERQKIEKRRMDKMAQERIGV